MMNAPLPRALPGADTCEPFGLSLPEIGLALTELATPVDHKQIAAAETCNEPDAHAAALPYHRALASRASMRCFWAGPAGAEKPPGRPLA